MQKFQTFERELAHGPRAAKVALKKVVLTSGTFKGGPNQFGASEANTMDLPSYSRPGRRQRTRSSSDTPVLCSLRPGMHKGVQIKDMLVPSLAKRLGLQLAAYATVLKRRKVERKKGREKDRKKGCSNISAIGVRWVLERRGRLVCDARHCPGIPQEAVMRLWPGHTSVGIMRVVIPPDRRTMGEHAA